MMKKHILLMKYRLCHKFLTDDGVIVLPTGYQLFNMTNPRHLSSFCVRNLPVKLKKMTFFGPAVPAAQPIQSRWIGHPN